MEGSEREGRATCYVMENALSTAQHGSNRSELNSWEQAFEKWFACRLADRPDQA